MPRVFASPLVMKTSCLKAVSLLLFAMICCLNGAFAGDQVSFASFNTTPITRGTAGVSTSLSTSSVPASDYLFVTVSGNYVPGTAGMDIWSANMLMELNNGGSTIFWPATSPSHGAKPGTTAATAAGAASLTWHGILPKSYTGGGPLNVRFFSTAGDGAYTGSMQNVVVTMHPSATPVRHFSTISSIPLTSGTAGYTQALDVSGLPATEYAYVNVVANFPAGATAYSSTIQMELNNGGSTVFWPSSPATQGKLENEGATTLRWYGILPTAYTGGGALSVKFRDVYHDSFGPYTSTLSNVSIGVFPASLPRRSLPAVTTGTLNSGSDVSAALNTSSAAGADYILATVTGSFTPGGTSAYSNTIQMELNNGGSTVYLPRAIPISGALNSTAPTTLRWRGVLSKAYVGGSAMSVKFFDHFTEGGPFTSSMSNVVVTLEPIYTAPANVVSLNRVNPTPSRAATVNWTLTFGTPITGLAASNFSLLPSVTGASVGTPTTADSGLTWNVPVTTGTGDGTLQLNLTNVTGLSRNVSNTLPFIGQPYAIDKTAPTISISGPSASDTKSGPVTYTVTYADANFSSSTLATGNITLNKTLTANGTVAVSPSGNPRTVTISSITGDGTLGISIAAGTATDTAGGTAPAAGPSTTFNVDNTAPVISSNLTAGATYGSAFSYTITATGTPSSFNATGLPTGLTFSGATISGTPTQTGSFPVTISANDGVGNTVSATLTLNVNKATATVTLGSLAQTYNGNARTASATTTPAGLTVNYTYDSSATAPTNAGSYAVVGTISDSNYQGSASGTLVIGKATATVTLGSLAQTYDGTARTASATTTPAGLTVNFTYDSSATAPTNAGSYAVIGTISNANYQGSASGTLVIGKATGTVTLGGLAQTYDGIARVATATTTPAGLTVNFTYDSSATAPTNAGSYAVIGTISNANYQGSASGTLVVGKATATVTLASLTQAYNGSARAATATTTPAGLPVNYTYDSSATAPTNAGSYAVIATINAPNHQGTSSATLEVSKIPLLVTANSASRAYGTDNPTLAATITGFVSGETEAVLSGAPSLTTVADAASQPTDYPITASIGTLTATNYTFTFANGTLTITPVTVTDWKAEHFTEEELLDEDISGASADADSDGISNLLEFAFGTDPRSNASGPTPLDFTGSFAGGGTIVTEGQPITRFEAASNGVDFRALFIRRDPATTGGLIYVPQFSADLNTWQPSSATPVVLATGDGLEVVSVPYPLFVGGKKARFFRMTVATPP